MHIVNEVWLVALCFFLIMSTPGVYKEFYSEGTSERAVFLIVFVSLFIIFNLVAILYDLVVNWWRPHCQRRRNIIEFRNSQRHHLKLINKRNTTMALKLEALLR
jgi:hypothetical protein